MPLVEPRPWRCPDCGQYEAEIFSSPVHCKCGGVFDISDARLLYRWGDIVARATSKAGITGNCAGCGKTQQKLNDTGVQLAKSLGLE